MSAAGRMYIDGQWTLSSSGETRRIINPADGSTAAVVAEGAPEDVRKAAAAARRAFYEGGWMEAPPVERERLLLRLADELEKESAEFARLETVNNGKPLRESREDVQGAVACLRRYADMATRIHESTYDVADPSRCMVIREPVGVCGQKISWNYPLLSAVCQLAPALAAGNTVVLKPSCWTPLTAIRLFGLIERSGFLPGVINLVLGAEETVGRELARSRDIQKLFPGVPADAGGFGPAEGEGDLLPEPYGKAPILVFADAQMETAVDYVLFGAFANQGEACSAGSRLLLDAGIYEPFLRRLAERAGHIVLGNGLSPGVEMGPLVSGRHLEHILSGIALAEKQGARLLCGGRRPGGELAGGFFLEPTILADAAPEAEAVRKGLFGPVLMVQKFRGEEQAVSLANEMPQGLTGGVFTSDGARAMRVIRRLRTGAAFINSCRPACGTFRRCGSGGVPAEMGIEPFTALRQIHIGFSPCPTGWFRN